MPMQKIVRAAGVLIAVTLSPALAPSVEGAVLCQKPSGVVVVRTACKKKESALDLAQFGAVGPKGDPGPAGSIEGAPAGGDLSGSYPAPTIAAAAAPTAVAENPRTATDPCAGPTPQTGVYCGTSTRSWEAPNDYTSIAFWRDRLGAIHIRGAAKLLGASFIATGEILFYLPEGVRPAGLQVFAIVTAVGTGQPEPAGALLVVEPSGGVIVYVLSTTSHREVILGDVEFRTDS